jgi:UDP-GlcNAc:undecaprenyl-phosphate/decaprenyl-phosphate GlcNAc-1-phosphate transferase
VHSLTVVASLLIAAVTVPALVRGLRQAGSTRANYRGADVAFPAGLAIPVVALFALVPLALLQELAGAKIFRPGVGPAVTYVIGVSLLGLLDDAFGGDPAARGWRGHARALGRGVPSTGAIKAVGALGLALFTLSGQGLGDGEYLLAAGVLVVATNLFNLLDLRPGRSAKALVLLAIGLSLGGLTVEPLWAVGVFVGPILVLLPLDLREIGMLGDTGSNAIGAVAGIWLVLTLSTGAQAIALALMLAITVFGEFRSIAAVIDRTPGLRWLDSLGRSHA